MQKCCDRLKSYKHKAERRLSFNLFISTLKGHWLHTLRLYLH